MDGILLINKPTSITSHKVVKIIRKKFNLKKVGHAGTLDPLATGLLIIMLGKATKLSNLLISQFKTYEVEMKLFLETNSGDITGKIIKSEKVRILPEKKIQEVIKFFSNCAYWQTPPLYSAIKIKGKKLYEYAREGLEIESPPRKVIIKKIESLSYNSEKNIISFFVECSKGTYIRSLVKDIAKRMGTIATVSQLKRISSGEFHIGQAIKLKELSKEKIIPFLPQKSEDL